MMIAGGNILEYFDCPTVRDGLAVDLVRVDECLGFLGVGAPRPGEDDNVVLGYRFLYIVESIRDSERREAGLISSETYLNDLLASHGSYLGLGGSGRWGGFGRKK
jgi:hypothetical protein